MNQPLAWDAVVFPSGTGTADGGGMYAPDRGASGWGRGAVGPRGASFFTGVGGSGGGVANAMAPYGGPEGVFGAGGAGGGGAGVRGLIGGTGMGGDGNWGMRSTSLGREGIRTQRSSESSRGSSISRPRLGGGAEEDQDEQDEEARAERRRGSGSGGRRMQDSYEFAGEACFAVRSASVLRNVVEEV